nr:transcription factor HES-1 [Anolis sagrei ordinatus]
MCSISRDGPQDDPPERAPAKKETGLAAEVKHSRGFEPRRVQAGRQGPGLLANPLPNTNFRKEKLKQEEEEETLSKDHGGGRGGGAVLNTDPSVLGKYRAGFNECVNEVTRFLSTCEGVNAEVRTRLLGHLAGCMSQISAIRFPAASQQQQPQPLPSAPGSQPAASFGQALVQVPATGALPTAGSGTPCKMAPGGPAVVPGEAPQVLGGFHLVPASDGQFAFLIPNTAFAPHGSNAAIPLFAGTGVGSGGLPVPTNAVSPRSGAPSLPSDSVWRPW